MKLHLTNGYKSYDREITQEEIGSLDTLGDKILLDIMQLIVEADTRPGTHQIQISWEPKQVEPIPETFNEAVVASLKQRHTNLKAHQLDRAATIIRAAYFGPDRSKEGSRRKRGYYGPEVVGEALKLYLVSTLWFLNIPQPKVSAWGSPRDSCGISAAFVRAHQENRGNPEAIRTLEQLARYFADQSSPYKFPNADTFLLGIKFGDTDWNRRNRNKNGDLFSKTEELILHAITGASWE